MPDHGPLACPCKRSASWRRPGCLTHSAWVLSASSVASAMSDGPRSPAPCPSRLVPPTSAVPTPLPTPPALARAAAHTAG